MEITLRPLEVTDISDSYVSWFKSRQVTAFLEVSDLTKDDCKNYLLEGRNAGTRFMYAICEPEHGKVIGTVKIGEIDRKFMISDLVTVIGDPDYWGKGLATKAIRQGSHIAFEEHGIRKLHGGMYDQNIGSIKAYLRAGWVVEAILHGQYVLNNQTMDRVVVSCFNPTFFPSLPPLPSTRFDNIISR